MHRKTIAIVLTVVAGGFVPAQRACAQPSRMILAREAFLQSTKRKVGAHDPALVPAYRNLISAADRTLSLNPPSVIQKMRLPPSGNKHDYMSMAPYWWPDSTKPNGLPFIRRDGEMNPESRIDHDGLRFQAMTDAVEALSLARYLTGDSKYSVRAGQFLRVWFVDSATRMNPNLEFAQAIPGVTNGRGTGIVDTRVIPQLVDAVALLRGAPGWTAADNAVFVQWCQAYLDWLRQSKNGNDERKADNNHGTWYDAQVVALALFTGDSALARAVLTGDTQRRIEAHIKADGSQPLELARTRPLHYTLFNLDAYTQLAEMAGRVGVDLWTYEAPSGGSLRKALAFVAPFADTAVKWRTPEVGPLTADDFIHPLVRGYARFGDRAFVRALEMIPAEARDTSRMLLLYPTVTTGSADDSMMKRVLGVAAGKLRRAATVLDPSKGYPRSTLPNGQWEQRPADQWTSGFFAGSLWYMYALDRSPGWKALANRWTKGLEADKTITSTHDLGFLIFDSFGHGYLLGAGPHYKDVVLQASASLASRYNPRVGLIKSWDTEGNGDARRSWRYPVIVDNLMNLEMLFWSAANGGDQNWAAVARRHALKSARIFLRPDGSTVHVALFDPVTGKLERTATWQGYSDSSAWARGQAWAIYGFANAYGRTGEAELLRAAQRAADFFLANLPGDGVPYWDFRDPAIPNAERDASAAAIASSGLFDLARRTSGQTRARYLVAAERILTALATDYLAPNSDAAILRHSVGSRPQNSEVDVGLVYADYYFVEALARRKGLFLE